MRKIRVLIVDDSSFVRVFLKKILSEDKYIQVVGTAANPYQAVEAIKQTNPDILTLDVEMPGMNGLEFLKKLMSAHPMPVIMVSTLTTQGSSETLRALEIGAADFITKPNLTDQEKLEDFKMEILSKIRAVSDIKIKKILSTIRAKSSEFNTDNTLESFRNNYNRSVIGIGVSTGGVQTLKKLLPAFPTASPGMILIQHMPQGFTSSFAKMLNKISSIEVKEARDGDEITMGQALLVPGNYHLTIGKKENIHYVKLNEGPKVNHQRPSVDVTFTSLATAFGRSAIAVLLTGMGRDGARGMRNIKKAGGYTIAQDRETAIVYGMPKAAVDLNAVDEILSLDEISHRLIKLTSGVN